MMTDDWNSPTECTVRGVVCWSGVITDQWDKLTPSRAGQHIISVSAASANRPSSFYIKSICT